MISTYLLYIIQVQHYDGDHAGDHHGQSEKGERRQRGEERGKRVSERGDEIAAAEPSKVGGDKLSHHIPESGNQIKWDLHSFHT